ncbi:hypothetical protein EYZ11_000136 [Aspergillus tanneri]|uniref:Uncharacterized protein n=1 Tax=Aspergillus tanneri TaxID=1220188 RepID=A0A4S3JXY3_9EURO|nr:hypothetical protein EYZ11_000136 [Aspergillus tanneri]
MAGNEDQTPPNRSAEDDRFMLTLLKYDKIREKSRQSSACALDIKFAKQTLADIRKELVQKKAMDKRHMNSTFCTKDGAEVSDNLVFKEYFLWNSEGGERSDKAIDTGKPYHLYSRSKKLLGEMDAEVKAYQKENLDLSLVTEDPRLRSLPNTTDRYAADMSEKQWAIVMRNNNLLCGQVPIVTDESGGGMVGLEPAHAPDMTFRIPRYRISDSVNVDMMETQDALQTSMAHGGFSQNAIQASVGGNIWGVSAAAKYGKTEKESKGKADSKFRDTKHMYISYDFPRVEIFLDEGSLKVSKECQADLDRLRQHPTKDELDRFYKKYGYLFVPQVQLGGRLYSIEESANFGSNSVAEKSEMFKTAAGASFSGFGLQAEVNYSKEKSDKNKTEKSQSKLDHSITWHADGGDTLLCNK